MSVSSLRDLIELYAPPPEGEASSGPHIAVAQLTPRWQLGVCLAPAGAGFTRATGASFVDGSSFVNGVATPLGGTHVRHASKALLRVRVRG